MRNNLKDSKTTNSREIAETRNLCQENRYTPSEAQNETVEKFTQNPKPLAAENSIDWMYTNRSNTAQRGVLEWWEKFRDAAKPVFEELYNEVALGREAQYIINSNSQPDYRAKLDAELTGILYSEIQQPGTFTSELRQENK